MPASDSGRLLGRLLRRERVIDALILFGLLVGLLVLCIAVEEL